MRGSSGAPGGGRGPGPALPWAGRPSAGPPSLRSRLAAVLWYWEEKPQRGGRSGKLEAGAARPRFLVSKTFLVLRFTACISFIPRATFFEFIFPYLVKGIP